MALNNYYLGTTLSDLGGFIRDDRARESEERSRMMAQTAQALQQIGANRQRLGDSAADRAERRYATDANTLLSRDLARGTTTQAEAARIESARQFGLVQEAAANRSAATDITERLKIDAILKGAQIAADTKADDPRILDYFLDAQGQANKTNAEISDANNQAEAAAARANQLLRGAFAARDQTFEDNEPWSYGGFRIPFTSTLDDARVKSGKTFNDQVTAIYTALGPDSGTIQWDEKAQRFLPRKLAPVPVPVMPPRRTRQAPELIGPPAPPGGMGLTPPAGVNPALTNIAEAIPATNAVAPMVLNPGITNAPALAPMTNTVSTNIAAAMTPAPSYNPAARLETTDERQMREQMQRIAMLRAQRLREQQALRDTAGLPVFNSEEEAVASGIQLGERFVLVRNGVREVARFN